MVKFCPKCGVMHDRSTDLCTKCNAKEEIRKRNSKTVLQRNKEKFARFVGGEWIGNLSRPSES